MNPGRRTALLLAAVLVVLAGTTLAVGLQANASGPCTGPRWPVKTLADPAAQYVDRVPAKDTVAGLAALTPHAVNASSARQTQVETRLRTVSVELVAGKLVHDGDLQLVVRDPGGQATMIAEFPDATCLAKGVSGPDRAAMGAARGALQRTCPTFGPTNRPLTGRAVLTGVQFHDTPHAGDTEADNARGAAPDEIELHPVLAVTDLTCAAGRA